MALALYRKYRPRTFAEVIGQEHVTEPLSTALRGGRLHHAYLFSGPRGCGKTSSARILARSLNCSKGPTPDPCGECDPCRALALDGAGSIDVIEIDAASHGGVDDARELRERAFFAPVASRFKVYVIDEAHMVSSAGFNALLKLVEEPPEYVKFVFATTEPEKVLGTIKSRTHHYPFRLVPPGVLRPHLEKLCRAEGVAVEPAVYPLVVRAGGGSVRDSLSVLDQLIAGAGPEGVTYARALALLGVTDTALIDEMCDALAAGDGAAAYTTIDRVAEAGHDSRRFASDLLERLRDLIVLQHVPDAPAKGLLDVPADQLERMTGQAMRMGTATLSRLADLVHNGLIEMRGTTAPRLLLELICARMLLPGADDSFGALLQRLERVERRLGAAGNADDVRQAALGVTGPVAAAPAATGPAAVGAPVVSRPAATPESQTQPPPESQIQPPPEVQTEPTSGAPSVVVRHGSRGDNAASGSPRVLDAAAVRRVWDEILGRMTKRNAAVVREAVVRDVDGNTLVLTFKYSFHASALSDAPAMFTDAVSEVLGGTWQVRCELSGQATGPASPATAGRPAVSKTVPGSAPPQVPAEDWPTPARPGGENGENPAGPGQDWPVPAQPGGPAARAAATGVPTSPEAPPPYKPPANRPDDRPAESPSGRPAEPPNASSDEPDHPEYAPLATDQRYDGFDPGDEPFDDEPIIRQSSEEQALRLLAERLGAERIGESDR